MTSFRSFGVSLLAALALASAAQAQTPSRQPNLHQLHDALNLSSSQEDAWNTFQAAMQPDPQEEARQRSASDMMPSLHAPQRVDLSIAAMQADLHDLERRGAAVKSFYATLSPEQQQVFDRMTAPPRQ